MAEDRAARVVVDPAGRSEDDPDALVVELVRRHADRALRIARRHSASAEDALDAYQRALVQLVRHRARLRPDTAHAWLFEVTRREALAVREQRSRLVPVDDATLGALDRRSGASAEERVLDLDVAARATEALGALKPDEARALTLQAAGLSYADIAEQLQWTATKTNRALTEGRARFRRTYAELETGQTCLRWAPVIAGRRDAPAAERARLRVHLRNCAGCRATVRELHDTGSVLALILPVGLVATSAPPERGGSRLGDLVARIGETLGGTIAERATGTVLKLQALTEAASAAKVAAIAASAVAVTGGGVVAHDAARRAPAHHRAAQIARGTPSVRPAAAVVPMPVTAATARTRPSRAAGAGDPAPRAHAARRRRVARHEFAGSRSGDFETAAPSPGEFRPPASRPASPTFETVAASAVSSHEFGTGSSGSGAEFGG